MASDSVEAELEQQLQEQRDALQGVSSALEGMDESNESTAELLEAGCAPIKLAQQPEQLTCGLRGNPPDITERPVLNGS